MGHYLNIVKIKNKIATLKNIIHFFEKQNKLFKATCFVFGQNRRDHDS